MAETDIIRCRLDGVPGYEDRVNGIYVTGNTKASTQHVIFFQGDVQDYREKMESHRDNKRHVAWNIESTASKIADKFPNSIVFMIRPAYMYLMTFAAYSNFWEVSESGGPVHSENHNALEHLSKLYRSALEKIYKKEDIPEDFPIHIVGFSKGCTVLNQLVFELHLVNEAEHLKKFVKQFKSFHWLDGGHSGGPENTWVTDDASLNHLAALGCDVNIHVSPYQIKDPMRVWIGKDEAKFHKKLKKLNVNVHRTVHFESEPASIENHFTILAEF